MTFSGFTTGELLRLATFLTRDIAAVWTLAAAAVALLSASAKRTVIRRITGGMLVWLVGFGGYLAPVDQSQFFDRGSISTMLTIALVLWAIVFANLVVFAAGSRLQR